jgi:predicted O-methyltransferase YrrM
MSGHVLRDLPPVDVLSRRLWGGVAGLARWTLARRRGRRALARMLDGGLPPWLGEPLAFLAGEPLEAPDLAVRNRVEGLRRALRRRGDEEIETWVTFPAPEAPTVTAGRARDVAARTVPLKHVAAVGSILPYWGTFLFLCAKSLRARAILELGACAGISSAYLAAAPAGTWLTTVEGSEALSRLAASHLAQTSPHARVLNMSFDDALDVILASGPPELDLVFLDGEHTAGALRHYFERVLPHLREGGAFLIDDIHWSEAVETAWTAVSRSPGLAWSIDLGRIGLCVRGRPDGEARTVDFSPFTAFWRRGGPAAAP